MKQAFDDDLIGGRYRLVRQVGRGGMGTVWQAQDEMLDRTVAIKQLTPQSGTSAEVRAQQVQRVNREARMAARLDHPGIVRVHDVIDWEGSPAIVMEYVPGRSLAARLRESTTLTVEETVRLGSALLDALRHAHAAGVVHRDLKPDNILLVGTRTVITDFGIARPLVGATTLTPHGSLIGTPAFMSPEQIEGKEVAAASDLWSLGVTLYTAVEGCRPFEGETITELCLAILTRPVPVPRNAGPLTPLLQALLAKDPAARATAEIAAHHLAEIDRLAVTPAPTAPEQSTATEVPRPPQPSVGTRDTELGEAIGGQHTHLATTVTGHPDTVTSARPQRSVPDEGGTDRQLGNPAPGPPAVTRRVDRPSSSPQELNAGRRARSKMPGPGEQERRIWRPRRLLVVVTLACAVSAAAVIVPLLSRGTPGAPSGSAGTSPTTPRANATAGAPSATPFSTLSDPNDPMNELSMAFAPNGTTLAVGVGNNYDQHGSTYLWDTTTGARTATLTNPNSDGVTSVAFAPNGTTLAVGGDSGSTYLWDTTTGKLTATLTAPNSYGVVSVAFAANGTTLAVGDFKSTTYLWDTTTRKLTATLVNPNGTGGVSSVAFAPNGTTLAVGGSGSSSSDTYLWDTATEKVTTTLTNPTSTKYSSVSSVAFAPSGTTLAVGDNDGKTYLWDTATGKLTTTLTNPTGDVSSVAFAPSGTTLAVGGGSGSSDTYLWDTATGKLTTTLTNPTGGNGVSSVAFAPDGTTVAVHDSHRSTYLWKIAGGGQ
ncbi:protein kinase [Kitasatospora sp. NPDC017646]|uniref:WD40 repeat domain-containing serine/threonine protein kinase n=1 Tax=Kitasatospora sp. NPDC017646 TaxID=3364024 RepID=UPI0037B2CD0D